MKKRSNDVQAVGSSPNDEKMQIEAKMQVYEDSLQLRHPLFWWASLLIPPTMIAGALVAIGIIKGWLFALKLMVAASITFIFFGRLVILMGQNEDPNLTFDIFLSPFQLFCMVSYMDLAAAILVAFHVGLLFELPFIGTRAKSFIEDARFVMNRFPIIEKGAFIGLVTFIAFPLAATGAIGGSILGTLLGLSRISVFSATIIGCLIGNGLLLKFAEQMEPITKDPRIKYSSIVLIILLILFMEWRYRKSKESYRTGQPQQPENLSN